jgi:hypothetical protein
MMGHISIPTAKIALASESAMRGARGIIRTVRPRQSYRCPNHRSQAVRRALSQGRTHRPHHLGCKRYTCPPWHPLRQPRTRRQSTPHWIHRQACRMDRQAQQASLSRKCGSVRCNRSSVGSRKAGRLARHTDLHHFPLRVGIVPPCHWPESRIQSLVRRSRRRRKIHRVNQGARSDLVRFRHTHSSGPLQRRKTSCTRHPHWQRSANSAHFAFVIVTKSVTQTTRALRVVQARLTYRFGAIESAARREGADPLVTGLRRLVHCAGRDFRRAIGGTERCNLELTLTGPSADAVANATVNERGKSAFARVLRHTRDALFVRARGGNVARHARGFALALLRAPATRTKKDRPGQQGRQSSSNDQANLAPGRQTPTGPYRSSRSS